MSYLNVRGLKPELAILQTMSRLDKYDNKFPKQPSVSFKSAPMTTRLSVLFGGFILSFGAVFFTFGMIFVWVFGSTMNINGPRLWLGETTTAPSEIFDTFSTNTSVNERTVIGYKYRFTTHDGQQFEGEAYSSTDTAQGNVEYLVSDPAINQMLDYRSSTMPPWIILLIAIFPGIGATMMYFGFRANRRKLKAFNNSKLARGLLVSKDPTNTRINNQTVNKYTFEFIDESGNTHQAIVKTHRGHSIEDEVEERIVYNADNPEHSVLVDNLPGKPEVSEDGTVGGVNPARVLVRMILPVGGIVVHVLVGIWLFSR
ncbi:MAG: hypothetical protein V3V10_05270 [Planctomycetota bacterium]